MPSTIEEIFGYIDRTRIVHRLEKPLEPVDVVLDTDTFNEIDDQYAIAYMLRSRDKLHVKAIYAAPFYNKHCTSAADGMRKSYEEILKVLNLMGETEIILSVFYGSEQFHSSETEAVISPAAEDLACRAMKYTPEHPLYVIAIAAITNITSALLLNPAIRDRIVVVWLGGSAHHWPDNREFNIRQDVAGGRLLFGCGVPVVQVPAHGVVSSFTTSGPELEYWLRGKNRLCDYLIDNTLREVEFSKAGKVWTRAIWDVVPVAWLLDGDFMDDYLTASPIPEYDNRYSFTQTRHLIRYVYRVKRDNLFADLFDKLTR